MGDEDSPRWGLWLIGLIAIFQIYALLASAF
jgi:hypothetical protein